MDRVFVAQLAASLGASSAEQLYVSVSRARESVTVYTDDRALLVETIQSSAARMTAHELLKLPAAANVIDPFESMLKQKVVIRESDQSSSERKLPLDEEASGLKASARQEPSEKANIPKVRPEKSQRHTLSL